MPSPRDRDIEAKEQQHIRDLVKIVGWVDDATVGDQQGVGAGGWHGHSLPRPVRPATSRAAQWFIPWDACGRPDG